MQLDFDERKLRPETLEGRRQDAVVGNRDEADGEQPDIAAIGLQGLAADILHARKNGATLLVEDPSPCRQRDATVGTRQQRGADFLFQALDLSGKGRL